MSVVWKFKASFWLNEIEMPFNSEILHAEIMEESVWIWALVNPDSLNREIKKVLVAETGVKFDYNIIKYINTLINNGYVFHVFEVE